MSVIVDAVVAGTAAGGKEIATAAVKDAYARLRELLAGKFSARPPATTALAEVESRVTEAPDDDLARAGGAWRDVLEGELVETGAAADDEILAAAHELLTALRAGGLPTGPKYTVEASQAEGLQIGDHNTQHNTFGTR